MLMFTRFLGKVDEWTLCSLEVLNGIVDLFSIKRIQTRNQSFDEIQLSIVPKFTNEEFTNSPRDRNVTTEEEFVLLVTTLLLPEIDLPPGSYVDPFRFATRPWIFTCFTAAMTVSKKRWAERKRKEAD
jgi:hypothetical protein